MSLRQRIGTRLRYAADRIDPVGAPKFMGWTFTFERGRGVVFHQDGSVVPRARGCRLTYPGDAEYEHAHTDAFDPA